MCGIVGFVGKENVQETLLKGLEKLEYRGYDSAGIAVNGSAGIKIEKQQGRIETLKNFVSKRSDIKGSVGIGHTRWATHGKPNKVNSHPHSSIDDRFVIVHNGVIDNFMDLKDKYLNHTTFISETDTEVVAKLIFYFYEKRQCVKTAFREAISTLKGSYAIAMLDRNDSSRIYAAKNKSPLLVGFAKDGNLISSDAMAMLHETSEFMEMHDEEYIELTKSNCVVRDLKDNVIQRESYVVDLDESDTERGAYPHYMLKEIEEQPMVIRKLLDVYSNEQQLELKTTAKMLNNCERLYIIACGTSYHAGLMAKRFFEKNVKIATEVHVASEFNYEMPFLVDKPLFLFISQSGETADSRAVLKKIKELGHPTITLTNAKSSTLSRESDKTLLLHAGPEIAVASTKAYVAQVAVLALLANEAEGKDVSQVSSDLSLVADAIERIAQEKLSFKTLAEKYLKNQRNAFFIGRTVDYYACLEGALKLKEISYIQAEGYASGELKHGPIALIEEGTPIFALITNEKTAAHSRGNIEEVKARGGNACVISTEKHAIPSDDYALPNLNELYSPLLGVICFQYISYFAALALGRDIDKPRNLAKSVTVE